MVGGMSAALARCRSLPAPALGAAWGGVLLVLIGLGVAAAPWALRAAFAAVAVGAATAWAWRHAPEAGRTWIAAAPVAAWLVGTFGWGGATVAAFAGWIALLRTGDAIPPLHWRLSPSPISDPPISASGWEEGDRGALGEEPLEPHFLDAEAFEPDTEEDEPEPDQWFTRTADAVEGELTVCCENGVGAAHVLFWPAFASPPRMRCEPADGVGRVRAAQTLPQGVRFEVRRPDGESGPVRICYEANAAGR